MAVLVLYDTEIKAWLVDEPLERAETHITNGYPHLADGWQAGTVQAQVIEVPEEERYRPELYEIAAGEIRRKEV